MSRALIFIFIICAFCLSQNGVYAFGAGNIPSFAYMEGRAFRHGDIEDVVAQLVKRGASGAIVSMLSKGSKFTGLDVKRVYFGNWLRDYSQAVDVASLKKVPLQTILTLCMVLGFMAHGYATHEFEVTPERLGVYLPTEHIDNPKGYAEGDDARKYNPALRGPVDPRELEIDPRTGMKNYIANENGHWDTSKALVRRTLERCIHFGRQNRQSGKTKDEYEAFRLLGQALHTLEDFSAHSNFCELVLISMGYNEVFPHVGDQVRIKAPNGKYVAPLVTGSFGSSDFIHSLLGEATDHLSEAAVTDINKELAKARSKSLDQSRTRGGPGSNNSNSPADVLRGLFFALPGGTGGDMSRDLDSIERMRASATGGGGGGGKRPEEMSPQELHSAIWKILTFRDSVMKKIEITIEKIPGLEALVQKISDSISIFVFTVMEPFIKPILQMSTTGLQSAAGEVIDNHDQYEVFNNPIDSDPTHSFLSKDHFNLLLNEPAGHIAQHIVLYAAKLVTKAWDDHSVNVHKLTEDVLECLFHPDFHDPKSEIQTEMMQCVRDWLSKLPDQRSVIQRLSKESVQNHKNLRHAGEGGPPASQGSIVEVEAHQLQHSLLGVVPGGGMIATGDAKGSGGVGYPGGPPMRGGGGGQATSYYNESKPPGGGGGGYGSTSSYTSTAPVPPHTMGGGGYGSSYTPTAPVPPHTNAYPMGGNESKPPGGGGYGSTSSYTPTAPVPPRTNMYPMSGGPPPLPPTHPGHPQHEAYGNMPNAPPSLPPPGHSGHHHHHHHPAQPQHESYTPSYVNTPDAPPSFPGSGPSYPGAGQEDDGFSFPGAPSFPDSNKSSFPGGPPSFPGDSFPGDGGYHAPPGPPSQGGRHHAPPGSPPLGGRYYAPPGPPPPHGRYPAPPGPPPHGGYGGFPNTSNLVGSEEDEGRYGFPTADTYSESSAPQEFPGGNSTSYPYGGGGARW